MGKKGKKGIKRQKWIKVGHRKVGRPKGSKNKPKEDLSGVKIAKLLGHCKGCDGIIGETDLESKCIYVCPSCHGRGRIKELKQALNRPKAATKKEYLESTVNAQHIDTLPLLKVIEEMPDVEVSQEEEGL